MIIIKNKLIQMILTGFLFAFILGVLSFYVLKSAITDDQSQREKQIVIIDFNYNNNEIGGLFN